MLKNEIEKEKDPVIVSGLPRRRQLLVVDDNESIQTILSNVLTFLGYGVTLADNGLEASNLFRTGSYDLVVTDIQMPLMNGYELSCLIKEHSPNTPVIVITGFCDDHKDWQDQNPNCIDAVIMKPFKLEEIESTVQRLLNSES